MKLIGFRIKNFRSIKDSGWQELAHDNITCLIGQNESGKTSVLEGLKAFHDGRLIEDMLRSDLSLPEVSCRFEFTLKEFEDRIEMKRVHPDIRNRLSNLETISICRKWESDLSSYVLTGEELNDFFQAEEDRRKAEELKIEKQLEKIDNDHKKMELAIEKAKEDLKVAQEKLSNTQAELNDHKKGKKSLFGRSKNQEEDPKLEKLNSDLQKQAEMRDKKAGILNERVQGLLELEEKIKLREEILAIQNEIHTCKGDLAAARENLMQLNNLLNAQFQERDIKEIKQQEEKARLEIELSLDELNGAKKSYDALLMAADKVLAGETLARAAEKARHEIEQSQQYMSRSQLGEEIYKFAPDFEFFEDFSSLLPNRIDLEDIVVGNTRAEGYKAALNFLTITGLDYGFFQQPSSRILKQKIENLNGEITLNFQDFWRQNVGKNNKIKINFELAHYDVSHAEKSGKPFIEFWIKDDSERLYPKQRSRGVRWFLSFFMELKATAMDKSRSNKLMLIDEPGVSLHARAQEDVLKVFDDIKGQMQIIYSTHSPHLIDVNKLYRVIAVQRAIEDDMNSETVLLDARSLKSATADTLSPVYATMGARLSQQEIIKAANNVVVKDLATYYFLKAVLLLTGYDKKECFFIPASGTASIPMIINILIGWGLEYIVLTFGNDEEKYIYNKLRKELFENNVDMANKQLLFKRNYLDVEDLFSTIDFKKHIVHVREGITIQNSEFLKDNNTSRAVIASGFLQSVTRGEVHMKDLDEESRDNINALMDEIHSLLK